jgi:hypothetical protein
MAGSPTADATRLMDRWRTSPAANTPGRLVSGNSGGRERPARRRPTGTDEITSRQQVALLVGANGLAKPVRAGLRADQHEQRRRRERLGVPPRPSRSVSRSRRPLPCPSTTSVRSRTEMLGVASIFLTR